MKIVIYGEVAEGKTTIAQLINVMLKDAGFTIVVNRDVDCDFDDNTMLDRDQIIKSLHQKIQAINETEIVIETVQLQRRGCACSECD
jgi:CO dehydrogenase nickel-insertion accessory protein CooC1